MKKHILTISPGYVKHWDTPRALAEIALNGVEREAENTESVFDYSRRVSDGLITLSFRNAQSQLSLKDLCLGNSTKSDHFGEGLKLAILTLVRAGKEVKIAFNKTLWTFFIEYNDTFESELLTFKETYRSKGISDLVIQVSGITDTEYTLYGAFFLDEEPIVYSNNEYGKITTEFNSCYISKMNTQMNTYFGYSLAAQTLDKNRERTVVRNSELVFTSLITKYFLDKSKIDDNWYKEFDDYINFSSYKEDGSWLIQSQVTSNLEREKMFEGKAYDKFMESTIQQDTYYSDNYTERQHAEALGIEYKAINSRLKVMYKNFKKLNVFKGKKLDLSNKGIYERIINNYDLTEEDKGLLKRALI